MYLTLDAKAIFGAELNQKDGHIFVVPSSSALDELLRKAMDSSLLLPTQIQLLQTISQAKMQYLTVAGIEKYITTKTRNGVNKIISKLIKLSVFTVTEFKLTSGKNLPKNKCLYLPNAEQLTTLFAQLELDQQNKQMGRSKTEIAPAKTDALMRFGLPPVVKENKINQGMILSQLPPFERFLPSRNFKENKYVQTIFIQRRKVVVQMQSPNRLMNNDDIKMLYTLMTLSINQQANMLDFYRESDCGPINSHYIEIKHILNALGKSAAGSYYHSFVKSIFRIKETIFDLHQLEAMYQTADGEQIFIGDDFRFFESCKSLSKTGVIVNTDIDNKQTIDIKPFGFVIAWNNALFKKMLTDRYFFVIPLKILAAPTVVFLFYMALRNYFSFNKSGNWILSVDDLRQKLNSDIPIFNFRRELLSGLNFLIEGKNNLLKDGQSQIDMQGFMLTVDMSDNVITQILCVLDVQKMLAYAGVTATDKGLTSKNVAAAPTSGNPLTDLNHIMRFKESRGDELPQDSNMRLLINTNQLLKDITIVKSKHFFTVTKNKEKRRITAYSDDSVLLSVCEFAHHAVEDQGAFFTHLTHQRQKLHLLTSGSATSQNELSVAQFIGILADLVRERSIIVESDELFDMMFNRGQLIAVACCWNENKDNTILLDNLFSLYKTSSRT